MLGAVLCSVFLAADELESRRNVELSPAFSLFRAELVERCVKLFHSVCAIKLLLHYNDIL